MNIEQLGGPARFRYDLGTHAPAIPAPVEQEVFPGVVEVGVIPRPGAVESPYLNIEGQPLSPREKEFLSLQAIGFSTSQIAVDVKRSEITVGSTLNRAFAKFGTTSLGEAIVRAIKARELDLSKLTSDLDFSKFSQLPDFLRETFLLMTDTETLPSNKEIGHKLKIKEQSVKNRVTKIFRILGLRSRYHTIPYRMEAEKRGLIKPSGKGEESI